MKKSIFLIFSLLCTNLTVFAVSSSSSIQEVNKDINSITQSPQKITFKERIFIKKLSKVLKKGFNDDMIEPCTGNTEKDMNLLTKSAIFNDVGINLTKYDWSNPDMNCHINTTLDNYSKYRILLYVGITALSIGLTLLLVVSFLGGLLVLGGGVYAILESRKKKKVYNYHFNQVGEYYRDNKLN